MMNYPNVVYLFLGLLFSTNASVLIAQPSFENPIILGFNPDPSICRVGDDYYLVTSTFEYFPGVPVYHSRDLVHWKMIGHVLHRPSQLDLDSIACSGGIYAPTIRYHNGTYYMITTLVGQSKKPQHRNFIVTAKNPAGPWSEPHWIAGAEGIDPSLFFDDDGKVYYSGNGTPSVKLWDKHRNIWVQELDRNTWQLIGKKIDVLDGGEYYKKGTLDGGIETGVNNYEASHIYKKDGKYYLLIAHGGTSQNHAVSIWKSDSIYGPYTINPENPILTHRDLSRELYFTSTGHADLVQTQKGDWWMVYLAKRPYGGENHIMGRETFMSPVDWSGTWPIVNPNVRKGRGELIHPRPDLPEFKFSEINGHDDFSSASLNNYWTFIRTPRSEWWSLIKRKGFLRIDLRPETISDQANPSFIGRRQEHKSFVAAVQMEFVPKTENETAGLVVERDKDYYLRYTFGLENGKKILILSQKNGIGTKDSVIAKSIIENTISHLQISSNEILYSFSYSNNGKDWKILKADVDGTLLGLAGAGRFTGTFIGIYASSNGMLSKNYADVDWFEYGSKIYLPDSIALENEYVKVYRNYSMFKHPDFDTRVIVALAPVTIHSNKGIITLDRGGVAVFLEKDSYQPPSGEYFEVHFKKDHPTLKEPEQWIEPEQITIVYEDEEIRIFEERLPPGGERALHSHAQRVVVRLNEVQLTDPRFNPKGTPGGGIQVPNTARFAEPMVHVVRNLSAIPLFNIVIEYKLPKNQ